MAPVPFDRPAWIEVLAVLVVCTALLFGLAKLDDSARRRHTQHADTFNAGAKPAPVSKAGSQEEWVYVTSVTPGLGMSRIVGPAVRVPAEKPPEPAPARMRTEPASYTPQRADTPPSEPAPIPTERLPGIAPAAAPAVPAAAPARAPRPDPMSMLLIVAATGMVLVAGGAAVLARR